MDTIVIEAGALSKAASYIAKDFSSGMIVVDNNTYRVAGKQLERLLAEQRVDQVDTVFITPNYVGDVVADGQSLMELILAARQHPPVVLVPVGSGTSQDS